MANERIPAKGSKYYLPKETYLTVVHYCRQYPIWMQELNMEFDARQGISYDRDRVQTSNNSDSTSSLGIKRAEVSRKKDMLEHVAYETANGMAKWIILGCCFSMTYLQLKTYGIPCGKDLYYKLRRKFYYKISERI